MASAPIVTRWDGDAYVPLGRSKAEANVSNVIGEIYRLTPYEERSEASHAHYFASIADGWANLPEAHAGRFQSPEALRKFALIKTGYATQQQVVCASAAEAQRLATVVSGLEEYTLCDIARNVVTIWRAESQSFRAMGKRRFEESKSAVLGFISNMIGVAPETLTRESGRAA